MRALANPHRVAILQFLLAGPPRTATECAAEVGGSPSRCSYHLRELARFGLVERVDADDVDGAPTDRRTRPWRAAAVGYSVDVDWADGAQPARAAALALTRAELVENQRLLTRYLEARDRLDPAWVAAADLHTYELLVTPDELAELSAAVAALLAPFRTPVRSDPPDGAAPVRVVHQAFPRLGAE